MKRLLIALLAIATPLIAKPFEAYLETWDEHYLEYLTDFSELDQTTIVLSFANFDFSGGSNTPGLDIQGEKIREVVGRIHGKGGEVKLAYGGAYAPLKPFLQTEEQAKQMAAKMIAAVQQYDLDGIDLDIEDFQLNVAATTALFKHLRHGLGTKELTFTVPGQAWAPPFPDLIKAVKGYVDCYSFMEYNIWVGEGRSFIDQIKWDIDFYFNNFGLKPQQIRLGLMPGTDDAHPPQNLTLADAKSLAAWAATTQLNGCMIWDLDRDAYGQDGNAPYSYSTAIIDAYTKAAKRSVWLSNFR